MLSLFPGSAGISRMEEGISVLRQQITKARPSDFLKLSAWTAVLYSKSALIFSRAVKSAAFLTFICSQYMTRIMGDSYFNRLKITSKVFSKLELSRACDHVELQMLLPRRYCIETQVQGYSTSM